MSSDRTDTPDPRVEAALLGEATPAELAELAADPALMRELDELREASSLAGEALGQLRAGLDTSEADEARAAFADTFAAAASATQALHELRASVDEQAPPAAFADGIHAAIVAQAALEELADAAPSGEDFADTFATAMAAAGAFHELRDALPGPGRFADNCVRIAQDPVTSTKIAARATPGPTDRRLDNVLAGEGTPRERRQLEDSPTLRGELAELEQLAALCSGAMTELRAAAPGPERAIGRWTATARQIQPSGHSARGPVPAATSSRRRATAGPRIGTLAAMLMAVAVVGTLTFSIMPRIMVRAKVRTAQGELGALQLAIIAYYTDHQAYPPSGNDSLVRYLDGDPSNGGTSVQYYPFDKLGSRITEDGTFLDPWGRPYHYQIPGTHNARAFDLWSLGPPDRSTSQQLANWLDGVLKTSLPEGKTSQPARPRNARFEDGD